MNIETHIQDYLQGTLDASETLAFENRLKDDSAFAKAYTEHLDVQAAIAQGEREDLKAQLKRVEKEGTTSKTSNGKLWLKIAAVAIVLLLSGVYILNNSFKNQTGTELYASYYEVYPNVLQPITRGVDTSIPAMQPFIAYEQKEWNTAIQGFQDLLNNRDEANVRFYYAMSLLNAGKTDQAYTQLKRTSVESTRFKAQSLWYKALIQLQKEDKASAEESLIALKGLNSKFKDDDVEKLLDALD